MPIPNEDAARRISRSVKTTERTLRVQSKRGRRFRVLGDASAASQVGAMAIIKGTVPGSSGIDTSSPVSGGVGATVVTRGFLAKTATDTTFTAGALLVALDGKAVVVDGVLQTLDVLNPSLTEFIGESGNGEDGVMVGGSIINQDGSKVFVLPTFELRSQPGWLIGLAPSVDDDPGQQILRHVGGEITQEASVTEDCTTP